jgi:hypothetical protein
MKKIIEQIREITGAREVKDSAKGFGDHVPNFVLETIKLKSFNEFQTKNNKKLYK